MRKPCEFLRSSGGAVFIFSQNAIDILVKDWLLRKYDGSIWGKFYKMLIIKL